MWKLVNLGEVVEIDGQEYTVEGLTEGNIAVSMRAEGPDSGGRLPSYPMLPDGKVVTVRKGDHERSACVVTTHQGVTVLGPARMRAGQEGTDCPYCWQQDVPGEKTGLSFGAGSGPTIPKAIPTLRYECPGCGMEWSSLEWSNIVRKAL